MAEVTVYTAEHTQEIYDATVVSGEVDGGSGHLILTTHDGTDIDAGLVKGSDGTDGADGADGTDGVDGDPGPAASIGTTPPSSPVTGQIWYDTNNLTGLTDLMAGANPTTSTTYWLALGYGYDTGATFSIAGGGCTITWTTTGNHLAGIAVAGLTAGNAYLAVAKVYVASGSPDVNLATAFKSSAVKTSVKNQDVTILQAFTADDTGAYFGIESGGATGTCIVKSFKVYAINQKGFPGYIYTGTEWEMLSDISQKGDQYSRVNTYGDQTVAGEKTWTGKAKFNPSTDVVPVTILRGTDSSPSAKLLDLQNHAGTSLAYFDYNGGLASPSIASSYGLFTAVDAGTLRTTKTIDISSTDLDSLLIGGTYSGNNLTHTPSGTGYYYVEVIVHYSGSATHVMQRATSLATTQPKIYIRTRVSSTWGDWLPYQVNDTDWENVSITNATGWSITAAIGRIWGPIAALRIAFTRTGSALTVAADGNITNVDIGTALPTAYRPIYAQSLNAYSTGRLLSVILGATGDVTLAAVTGGASIATSDTHSAVGLYFVEGTTI